MANFKVGDKVRCIDNIGAPELKKDFVYTVVEDSCSFVRVKEYNGGSGGFYKRRFEKVVDEPKFKVGSRVWSPDYGWGKVVESKLENFFRVTFGNFFRVTFGNSGIMFYTLEGKINCNSPLPSLFLDEVPASNWPNPPAKLDPSTFVVDQNLEIRLADHEGWVVRKFAMLKDGAVWVCPMNKSVKESKTLHKVTDFRLPIAPKGV